MQDLEVALGQPVTLGRHSAIHAMVLHLISVRRLEERGIGCGRDLLEPPHCFLAVWVAIDDSNNELHCFGSPNFVDARSAHRMTILIVTGYLELEDNFLTSTSPLPTIRPEPTFQQIQCWQ